MIETFEALRKIFNSEKLIQCHDSTLTITESHGDASLKSVSIVSVGSHATALKFDKCGFPGHRTFDVGHTLHRACDAIAFCLIDNEPFILCCELKSSEPIGNETIPQFASAHCFLAYVDAVLKTYHNASIDTWQRRYFVFHGAAKTPLSKEPLYDSSYNDSPERARIWAVQNKERIYLRKLLGKPS